MAVVRFLFRCAFHFTCLPSYENSYFPMVTFKSNEVLLILLEIIIPVATKNEHGDRLYDKSHVCFFCNGNFLKIGRHLVTAHQNKTEVAKILAIDHKSNEGKKKRSLELDRLRFKGDFYHNLSVLKTGGELKVYRRPGPGENVNVGSFKPCVHCLAFIRKHELWRHVKHCPLQDEKMTTSDDESQASHHRLQYESELLLFPNRVPNGASKGLEATVLSSMKCNEIARAVKSDKLILVVGSSLLEKGNVTKVSCISRRMRSLGKLLLELQDRNSDDSSALGFYVSPDNFDLIVESVKSLAEYREATFDLNSSFKKPGLALSIGYDLKKVAILLRGQALRERCKEDVENANGFLQLFDLEWKNKISAVAVRSLGDKNFHRPDVLPLTSDLLKLRDHITKEMPLVIRRLGQSPSLQE